LLAVFVLILCIFCRFETSDGTFRKEQAVFNNDPIRGFLKTVTGAYGFIAPDGVRNLIEFIADEYGYRVIKQIP
jgi:hypothetical protein